MGSSQNAPTKDYYKNEAVPAAPDWLHLDMGGTMSHIMILNRGSSDLVFSFDKGQNIHGSITVLDGGEVRDDISHKHISIQAAGAGGIVQIEAWRSS